MKWIPFTEVQRHGKVQMTRFGPDYSGCVNVETSGFNYEGKDGTIYGRVHELSNPLPGIPVVYSSVIWPHNSMPIDAGNYEAIEEAFSAVENWWGYWFKNEKHV
jgi:hypothetical protein